MFYTLQQRLKFGASANEEARIEGIAADRCSNIAVGDSGSENESLNEDNNDEMYDVNDDIDDLYDDEGDNECYHHNSEEERATQARQVEIEKKELAKEGKYLYI